MKLSRLSALAAMIALACAGCGPGSTDGSNPSGETLPPDDTPTTSLSTLLHESPEMSRDDLLEAFEGMLQPDAAAVSTAIDAVVQLPGVSVSYLHLAWSTESEIRKREFADFILAWQLAHPESSVTFHFINASAITHDYGPLQTIPGWEEGRHGVGGYGEVLWMREGHLIDFGKIGDFNSTVALVEKAESLVE